MSQIAPIVLVAPGSRGLNTERSGDLLSPQWATEARNCVLSNGGRIAARKGWANQTATPITDLEQIDVIHEFIMDDGTVEVISAADNKIYKNITDFTVAGNDITSSTAPTADNWQFVNFNDKCIGFQAGHTAIVYTGTGDFANITAATGTLPAGNAVCAAYGRVWASHSDKQTLYYSALLDETKWAEADGGGAIDMRKIWTKGMDEIVAVAAFNGALVVFGRNHIVLWTDGQGNQLGVDPTLLYVADVVEGTGCIARDSVQPIGEGDLMYLSRHGLQLLGRVIMQKSNPVSNVTKNIRTYFTDAVSNERGTDATLARTRSVYNPETGFYLLLMPDTERAFVVDVTHPFQDDDGEASYAVTEWQFVNFPTAAASRKNGDLLFGFNGSVGKYSGTDDDGSAFDLEFMTGWLDLGEANARLKLLKEVSSIVNIGGGATLVWKWEWDFSGTELTKSTTYTAPGSAEFGEAEYSVDEYSGGLTVQRKTVPGRGQGQFIRVGVTASINGYDLVLQQIQLVPKVARLVA